MPVEAATQVVTRESFLVQYKRAFKLVLLPPVSRRSASVQKKQQVGFCNEQVWLVTQQLKHMRVVITWLVSGSEYK